VILWCEELDRLKVVCVAWNVYKSVQVVQSVEMALDAARIPAMGRPGSSTKRWRSSIRTFANNKCFHPNYGEQLPRRRADQHRLCRTHREPGGSVKRFCKKQQMQWTKYAAHLLLQIGSRRSTTSSGGIPPLDPDFLVEEEESPAACPTFVMLSSVVADRCCCPAQRTSRKLRLLWAPMTKRSTECLGGGDDQLAWMPTFNSGVIRSSWSVWPAKEGLHLSLPSAHPIRCIWVSR